MEQNNMINMNEEAMEAVNAFCQEEILARSIAVIAKSEDAMQTEAHNDYSGDMDYMFRLAYELRQVREVLEIISKSLGYEQERE